MDSRFRTSLSDDPGIWGTFKHSIRVLLRVLPKVPDIPILVLGEKGKLRFRKLSIVKIPVPQDDRSNAVDHLGEISDRKNHLMGDGYRPASLVDESIKD